MDGKDFEILRTLQADARITNADLAERVGLSPSSCWTRIRHFEQEGVIEKYITILNQTALGYPDTVITEVVLDRHDDEVFNKFESALLLIPEITEAYRATGEYDYYIKTAV